MTTPTVPFEQRRLARVITDAYRLGRTYPLGQPVVGLDPTVPANVGRLFMGDGVTPGGNALAFLSDLQAAIATVQAIPSIYLLFNPMDAQFGGHGDAVEVSVGVTMQAGVPTLTVGTATFSISDVGKIIEVPGAGTAGGVLHTIILGFTSPTQVTLLANAATAVNGTTTKLFYGHDDAPAINAAIQKGNALGGAFIQITPKSGKCLIDSSLTAVGCSKIVLMGNPGSDTRIVCTSSLNGSDPNAKNVLFHALNFDGPVTEGTGYRFRDIGCQDLTFDGSRQSPAGIPGVATGGYNLAGVEIMNVDDAFIRNCKFLGCYGNGAIIESQDPRQFVNGFQNGVRNPRISNNVFINCIRGVLPQYTVTGDVAQIGAAYGGSFDHNTSLGGGGVFFDFFNCIGTHVTDNVVYGHAYSAIGANQGKNFIHSDFGLVDCVIARNVFYGTGGIFLTGRMYTDDSGNFSVTGGVPTPGPKGCTIEDNHIRLPNQKLQLPSPAVGASGATYANSNGMTVELVFIGGAGIQVATQAGGKGNFSAAANLGVFSNAAVRAGDVLRYTYTTAPTQIVVNLAPNLLLPGISVLGGTSYNVTGANTANPTYTPVPGQAVGNKVRGNTVDTPGTDCIQLLDATANEVMSNTLYSPGAVGPGDFVSCYASLDVAGCGTFNNNIHDNHYEETRTGYNNVGSNYRDYPVPSGAVRHGGNRVTRNRLETSSTNLPMVTSSVAYFAENKGPGLGASGLGPLAGSLSGGALPASGTYIANPYPYDVMLAISGGTGVAIATGPQGATQATGLASGMIAVRHGEGITIGYTTAPTVNAFVMH